MCNTHEGISVILPHLVVSNRKRNILNPKKYVPLSPSSEISFFLRFYPGKFYITTKPKKTSGGRKSL
ncbi:hypothetical protein Hanom_Chr13g01219641 [Helianthus anomalus]